MSFRPRTALALAAALLVAVGASGPGANAGAARDVLRLSVGAEPHSLNPLLAATVDDNNVESAIFEPLVDFDARNHPVPALLSVVPTVANGGISRDGTRYVLHLRRDVRWQDGARFTSADVAFTIHAHLDPKVNTNHREGWDRIVSVETPDPATVVVRLRAPFAPFLATAGTGLIVPAHLLAHAADLNTDPFGAHPVGTGAYRFKSWLRGDRIELEASPTARERPAIPRLVFADVPDPNTEVNLLLRHDVDFGSVSSGAYRRLHGQPGLRESIEPANSAFGLALNVTRPLLRDVRVRQAISAAIDRPELVRLVTAGLGTPAYGDLPPLLSPPPPGTRLYDPARAKALLDAAGWRLGPDAVRRRGGVPLRLELVGWNDPTIETIALQVQAMLARVGVGVRFKFFAVSLYYTPDGPEKQGAFDLAMLGWSGGNDPDDAYLYTCANRAPRGFNSARYCSPEMDRLQAAATRELDPAKRARLVAGIQRLVVRDVPYAYLYYVPSRLFMDPALRRPLLGAFAPYYHMDRWSFGS